MNMWRNQILGTKGINLWDEHKLELKKDSINKN